MTFGQLMALIRDQLYINRQPAEGWSVARDGSILKAMLKRRSGAEVAQAIQGLAWMRDKREQVPDPMRMIRAGQPLDLRLLWAKSDLTPVWTFAMRAYWAIQNRRPRSSRLGMQTLGGVISEAIRRADEK